MVNGVVGIGRCCKSVVRRPLVCVDNRSREYPAFYQREERWGISFVVWTRKKEAEASVSVNCSKNPLSFPAVVDRDRNFVPAGTGPG